MEVWDVVTHTGYSFYNNNNVSIYSYEDGYYDFLIAKDEKAVKIILDENTVEGGTQGLVLFDLLSGKWYEVNKNSLEMDELENEAHTAEAEQKGETPKVNLVFNIFLKRFYKVKETSTELKERRPKTMDESNHTIQFAVCYVNNDGKESHVYTFKKNPESISYYIEGSGIEDKVVTLDPENRSWRISQ